LRFGGLLFYVLVVIWFVFWQTSGRGIDLKRQWYRIIEGIMNEGQSDDTFRSDIEASELAQVFNRSMRSVFLDWCIADCEFDLV